MPVPRWYLKHGDIVRAAAAKHAIPQKLLAALIQHESGGHQFAINPEPRWRYMVDVKRGMAPFRVQDGGRRRRLTWREVQNLVPPPGFRAMASWVDPDSEWQAQKWSWGYVQCMGSVARERGFKGLVIPEIIVPEINIDLGARILRRHLRRKKGRKRLALLSYNGGGDPSYPQKVLRHEPQFS